MVKGFKFSAVEAAIKHPGRLDLGLIYSETPAAAAGLFTTNTVQAAPVVLTRPRLEDGLLQAVVVNSGNANACMGRRGLDDAARMSRAVSESLGIDDGLVGVCSTGVIGRPLPVERIEAAAAGLVESLRADGLDDLARAIMTTDTRPKTASVTVDLEGHPAAIVGVAKGSGMIHPNLATMLVFLMTDAKATATALKTALDECLPESFHAISVDGDTSTNDTLLFLANGAAEGPEVHGMWGPAGQAFFAGVAEVCRDLAVQIVADAEGGTKVITIHVKGAASQMEAEMVVLSIALSPLCKTAFYGADPNWGRIICAAGYSGARLDPDKVDISFEEATVCKNGRYAGDEALKRAEEIMKRDAFTVTVDLKQGAEERRFITSDLSVEYVRINSEYTT